MKGIIVEDEQPAMEELQYLIETYSSIDITDTFSDGLDVLKFLQSHETDVIFLDINIPSLDGMLLASNIHKFSKPPYIIFTTAYKEHAAQAFELEAFDYILKPYDEKRIAGVLKKVEEAWRRDHQPAQSGKAAAASPGPVRINLKKDEKIIVADVNDIYYAEAQEKVTDVYSKNSHYIINKSISELYDQLPKDQFFRCHRSYLVNLSKIHEIIPWFNQTYLVQLKDLGTKIPVSRSNTKTFRQLMNL
ncbi:LytTR family DNA-binding domain-containing protein [Sporolactobacillus sp. Y61]|jgi:two-component system LytT family response regulator|uniref:LytTR family DNA-binding domain-containing protein n=1 Tax=Sporolactobacillus sp. Y61 TaxID=3160863 RepID=A0AAU8IEG1_9BACL|nr:LytTR family DNA-binding domain-containing protein [Sporolactobacillus sp. THM19-2]RYL94430.1 response regulator transcription factor [Sporolactobacillus sp. THM19-2]